MNTVQTFRIIAQYAEIEIPFSKETKSVILENNGFDAISIFFEKYEGFYNTEPFRLLSDRILNLEVKTRKVKIITKSATFTISGVFE